MVPLHRTFTALTYIDLLREGFQRQKHNSTSSLCILKERNEMEWKGMDGKGRKGEGRVMRELY